LLKNKSRFELLVGGFVVCQSGMKKFISAVFGLGAALIFSKPKMGPNNS